MKITVTGSLGHISKPLTQLLVKQGHTVTVISSKAEKEKDIKALGANAAIGSVEDEAFLTTAFTGADLVYTMIPPGDFRDQNYDVYARVEALMNNFKQAITKTGIKRVIHLSSIGAHAANGLGLLRVHYIAETTLKQLPKDVHLTFMRPTGFYYNLLSNIPMIKGQGFIAANYGADDLAILVAPVDIAAAIAEEIEKPAATSPAIPATSPTPNPSIRYVASEELSCNEVARILGEAIGKPDLKWIRIPGQQMLDALIAMGMKPDIAAGLVEMYGAREALYEDYYRHRPTLSKTKLTEFAREFAAVYNSK